MLCIDIGTNVHTAVDVYLQYTYLPSDFPQAVVTLVAHNMHVYVRSGAGRRIRAVEGRSHAKWSQRASTYDTWSQDKHVHLHVRVPDAVQ